MIFPPAVVAAIVEVASGSVKGGDLWAGEGFTPAEPLDLKSYAAGVRWLREIGGVSVGGMPVPTDARTQSVLTAAYASAVADAEYAIADWKVAPGTYVALSNATIRAVAVAVRSHIQACFTKNREVDEAIDAGQITGTAGIDAAFAAMD